MPVQRELLRANDLVGIQCVKSSNLLTETYGYDEAGQRVKRTTVAKVGADNVTTTTYYVGAGQEVQNGVPVRYYSLGGNTLGVRQGASVRWLYGDHLGSTSAISRATYDEQIVMACWRWAETIL